MTTWVLLRGLMRDQRHWNGFDQRLRQRGCTVFTPDLPGNGILTHQVSPLTIPEYASSIWQQLDEHLAGQAFYLLGLSMGGMLAMEMAKQRPEQIKHAFVLNSSAANLSPWYQRFNGLNALSAWLKRCRGRQLNPIESTIVRLTSYRHRRDIALIARWSQYRHESTPHFSNACRQLWAAFRYRCPAFLPVPVSILSGDRDALVNIQTSKALAQHFNVDLVVLAYCGHDITIDAPAKLAHYLFEMISLEQGEVSEPFADYTDLLDEERDYHEARLVQSLTNYLSALPSDAE
ncbi:alpha/beta hydrolase [Shewanella sp. GD03713]|uniref:alpha/beta fold hydrolase n=1 Tax=Shewanella sp. GD03713 TaxID=2975372 RepID=UPI000B345429|nr:alpha/beta hydrolase [Shewanella sp. GD03713]MDH1470766.1 alpha/beta hydrolase [Shewanella sp. GD03713]QXN26575.1 alpha/beta hydrolase [Shewanella putrefaciens]VEE60385.1 acetoin dehydrogenase E2 subunit dihydrolipoyllysine-residue acetyltransferase [Shewanella putrefaciens]